jgi:hypothetical protein
MCAAVLSAQHIRVDAGPPMDFPGVIDSNSPAHWWDGQLVMFNSATNAIRTSGPNFSALRRARVVEYDTYKGSRWIEATYMAPDGVLYAWYHHEPGDIPCPTWVTAPVIGALRSTDNGRTFVDLGIVLQSGEPPNCDSQNGYFAGGNGDFSVILDRDKKYLYFLFSHYGGPLEQQGVALARMAYDDRDEPAGKVIKYNAGDFTEPGLGGKMTPVLPALAGWETANPDSFWGPSIHWNTFIQRYVVLLNRSCCTAGWPQEGVYAMFIRDLADPTTWTKPEKLLDGVGWYPQVLGTGPGETDKEVGQRAPLFVYGVSQWILTFTP